jgi:hypothetical protein
MIIQVVFVEPETMQRESSFADYHPEKRMLNCRRRFECNP